MIKNYLKIAFRNLWRHKIFSSNNLMGLAVGMTACFLIFLFATKVISASPVGLASYSTIQRTKETGIRQVVGASVSNIALFAISFQAIKAAIAGPVNSFLKTY